MEAELQGHDHFERIPIHESNVETYETFYKTIYSCATP